MFGAVFRVEAGNADAEEIVCSWFCTNEMQIQLQIRLQKPMQKPQAMGQNDTGVVRFCINTVWMRDNKVQIGIDAETFAETMQKNGTDAIHRADAEADFGVR